MTAEHIWSDWMGRLFLPHKGTYQVEWGTALKAKQWKSKYIDAVAKVVCKSCNEGWMSEIDAQASLTMSNMILHGAAVSLLPIGIASIAMFAYKAAVVIDYARRDPAGPFFPPAERKRFSEGDHFIPPGVQVWISSFRPRGAHVHGSYSGHYGKIKSGKYRNFGFNVLTYAVGFVLLQVVSYRWGSRLIKPPEFTPYVLQANRFDVISTPIWPPEGRPVLWPTQQYITNDTVMQFAERWGRVAEWDPS
jgi:hypothetical protein